MEDASVRCVAMPILVLVVTPCDIFKPCVYVPIHTHIYVILLLSNNFFIRIIHCG